MSDSENSSGTGSSNQANNSNNTMSNRSNSNMSAVSVQKIAFWPTNPTAWFRVIETQFTAARITEEVTKFNHVISMLDAGIIDKCMDILETIPTDKPYTEFRDQVIIRMSESEQSRLQKVLLGTDLGDRRPSELLSHMKSLAGDSFKEEVLKALWLKRLPPQMRAILAISSESLTKLAVLGDKIMETMPGHQVSSVEGSSSNVSKLELQVSQLSKKFNELNRNFSNNRGNYRQRLRSNSRNRSRSKSRSKDSICYFHRKFGEQARNCTNWCKWKKPENNRPNSGNGQTGQ